jgi:glutaredoxin-related protein
LVLVLGEDTTITAMRAISNADTTPQIFIGGKHIGGNDELIKHFNNNTFAKRHEMMKSYE